MKFLLATAALFASSAVMAQSSSACAADYIVETCLGTQKGRLASCGTNDYVCECGAYGDILTCFNNCPNDPRKQTYQGQQEIFCGYASQFPSSTTSPVAAATTGSAITKVASVSATATGASGSATATGSGTATGSAASASATKTNNAADLSMKAGSVLAAVAAVVAAVL